MVLTSKDRDQPWYTVTLSSCYKHAEQCHTYALTHSLFLACEQMGMSALWRRSRRTRERQDEWERQQRKLVYCLFFLLLGRRVDIPSLASKHGKWECVLPQQMHPFEILSPCYRWEIRTLQCIKCYRLVNRLAIKETRVGSQDRLDKC